MEAVDNGAPVAGGEATDAFLEQRLGRYEGR